MISIDNIGERILSELSHGCFIAKITPELSKLKKNKPVSISFINPLTDEQHFNASPNVTSLPF